MHDLVASERINIQEIDASQGYFLDRGAPIPGRFSGLDNINSCVAIESMKFATICVGLFNLHNARNVRNSWVSPVVRQLRQPYPEEYSYTDPLLAVFLLKQWSLIPSEVLGDNSCHMLSSQIIHFVWPHRWSYWSHSNRHSGCTSGG